MCTLNLSHWFISLDAWLELEIEHIFQLGKCVFIMYSLVEFLYPTGVIFFWQVESFIFLLVLGYLGYLSCSGSGFGAFFHTLLIVCLLSQFTFKTDWAKCEAIFLYHCKLDAYFFIVSSSDMKMHCSFVVCSRYAKVKKASEIIYMLI